MTAHYVDSLYQYSVKSVLEIVPTCNRCLFCLYICVSNTNYLHTKMITKVIIYLSIYLTHQIRPINSKDGPESRLQVCLALSEWLYA